ncbi:MAG TPA: DegT/DnrJ/EryC1/StrS family aminotransferase, partial [Opitutae bacterium]|nr:DegT/DnrJ/EryC1/StrS family aminotransferase [Opitutae bacterium]
FETAMAQYLGVKHAFGVSSGTDALLLALMVLDIGPGDEVLCPTDTFFATGGSIARLGATPVFVDVEASTFNIDVQDAAQKITPKTKAIMPVHLFGQTADMNAILELASKHKLRVIEDTAQAIGARYAGKHAGTLGDFGAYSFFPTKNLGGFGDSGLLVTQDDTLAEKARLLRVHGARHTYLHEEVGGNFRMDPLQAAFLLEKLPKLDSFVQLRRSHATFYNTTFTEELKGPIEAGKLILPQALTEENHSWNQYTLLLPKAGHRDTLMQHLSDQNIGCRIYYPYPLDAQPCFAKLNEKPANTPQAHSLCKACLSIPVYPELTTKQRSSVADAVIEFIKRI